MLADLVVGHCRDYVRYDEDGQPCHAMHHEMPTEMPVMLKRITGEDDVRMVGAEGVLAGGPDKLVNELQGEDFEVRVAASLIRCTPLSDRIYSPGVGREVLRSRTG